MKRRGSTLLEMLTVISLLAVVMAIGSTLLISLMRMHKRVTSDIDQRRTLAQLADRLRQDAHATLNAQLSPEGRLSLPLANQTVVEYAAAGSQITRQVLDAGMVRHRETFALSPACKVQFAVENADDGRRQLVRCEVSPLAETSSPREFAANANLEAAVGISSSPPRPARREETPP
jgi:prepilin-type N-terminal cleavage/methylation domain-containing protein